MLSQTSQREINTTWYHLTCVTKKKKKSNSEKKIVKRWLPGHVGGGNGKMLVNVYKLSGTRYKVDIQGLKV